MHTTDFSTPCCEKQFDRASFWGVVLALVVLLSGLSLAPRALAAGAEISNLRVEQAADGLYLSATMRFELPPAVEEALLKGIALSFVAEAQVYRDRWYWYDKSIITATRTIRVSYVPLTRRWRLSLGVGVGAAGLAQSFDNLVDAMAAASRFSRWKIADGSEIDADSRHNVDFRFRLDTSQLPRPLQFGVTGNNEWHIAAVRNVRPEPLR